MRNRFGVLLTAAWITSAAVADDTLYNPFGARDFGRSSVTDGALQTETGEWARSGDSTSGASKADILKRLERSLARSIEKSSLIEQEIRCVQRASEEDGSLSSCYETARQQRQYLKQKYGSSNPYQRRSRQREGGMPNFNRMGMGMMPTPW